MEKTGNLLMYPTLGPIVKGMANGQMMSAQLTATSNPEDASKFRAMFEKQQRSQPTKKADTPESQNGAVQESTAVEEEKVPQEDPLEQVKKLAEQGYAIFQPSVSAVTLDGQVYQAGEYVMAWKGDESIMIPITGLEPWQQVQLQSMLSDAGQTVETVDQATDQLLEDSAPEAQTDLHMESAVKGQSRTATEAPREEVRSQQKDDEGEKIVSEGSQVVSRPVFENVKAAPVKVGENFRSEHSEAPDVSAQINAQLTNAAASGQPRVEVQLTPENLGKVTVDIVYNRNGTVQAVLLSAERSETRDILTRHATELQSMLSRSGEEPVRVEVQHQEESQRQQENPYEGHSGQGRQQGQQRQDRQEHDGRDFLQQLRLGLIPAEESL